MTDSDPAPAPLAPEPPTSSPSAAPVPGAPRPNEPSPDSKVIDLILEYEQKYLRRRRPKQSDHGQFADPLPPERVFRQLVIEFEDRMVDADHKTVELTALLSEKAEQNLALQQQAEKDA